MKEPRKREAIVIGSGFGGLALALRLQASGFATTVVEKLDQVGGRAYVYRDKGFTFDGGPTVITAPHCLEELFEVNGETLQDYVDMIPVTPFYRLLWEDGTSFDYCNDSAKLESQIRELEPQDWDGYQRFLKYSEDVFREGYEKLAAEPFLNFWSMVKVAPQLARLSAYRSVYSMVSKFVKNEYLRQAFSFHSLLVGGNPFATSSIYTLIHFLERKWGVFFPRGGTGALVNGMVELLKSKGGRVLLDSEVDQILTREGRVTGVRLANQSVLNADLVASNADVHHTYTKLLREERRLERKRRWAEKCSYSMSLVVIYFGTKKKYDDIAHHSVIFGPRYKELLADIFDKGVLAEDFSLYLHRPTESDPSMAPDGCDAFYVLSPVPHLGRAAIDWNTQGEVYADKILRYLESHYLPGLSENLVTRRVITPFDFQMNYNSYLGSAFSIEPILTQSAYFRTSNRDSQLEGLYFVGAGTHPGAGIPGVVNSAKATMKNIAEDFSLEIPNETPLEPTL